MSIYPIYRKFKNGKEFHKVTNADECISILVNKNFTRILHTSNSLQIADVLADQVAMDSSRDEFEKVFGEAMWKLNKSNTVV